VPRARDLISVSIHYQSVPFLCPPVMGLRWHASTPRQHPRSETHPLLTQNYGRVDQNKGLVGADKAMQS
jgi:hypothetical protein